MPARRTFIILLLALLGIFPTAVVAAHTKAQLILPVESARPGETVLAGIHLTMEPGWHIYWKNSGASGTPTAAKWDLPAGVTAGEMLWPLPEKLPPDEFVTYIYENEVVLLVPITLATDLSPGAKELKANVSWLECKEQCIPGKQEISATLNVGPDAKTSPDSAFIQVWQRKLPLSGKDVSARAWWEKSSASDERPLILEWNSTNSDPDFFPYSTSDFEVQSKVENISSDSGNIRIRKLVKKYQGEWPKEIAGVLIEKSSDRRVGYESSLEIGASPNAGAVLPTTASQIPQALWKMLLYAFIGGLILNIMPCVLPVIALKILGFVGEARNNPAHVRKLGLVYALGVIVSFLALAALVIGVKAAGHRAGWGMQFSSPQFIIALTTLVTLVALNLFGVFEITLSGRAMNAAGTLASRSGAAGAFFNGVLATVLATPCTAPFLGAALGFAFAQSAPITVLIFVAVALGLASPYVVLSWEPSWLKFLPKPGAWMEKFKMAMGFPMLATAIWLFGLVSIYYADRAWWLGVFLLFVSAAAWVFGQFVQRGGERRGLSAATAIVLLIIGYAWVVEGKLRWREPQAAPVAAVLENSGGIAWQPWSHEAVRQARGNSHPVLVDFTARWCLTCNTIVKPALESNAVQKKMKELNAVALLADYTRFPPEITDELARYNRAGVPLILVFPKDSSLPAIVLPEAITPGMVTDALDRAAK